MDYFIKNQNLTEDNLKDDLFKDSMCLAIHNKLLRKAAVKEIDAIIHKTIMNDDVPSYHDEKVERYKFLSALLKQITHNLDRDFISPEVAKKWLKFLSVTDPSATEKLDFETSRRIISEAHDILGSRFITISGDEPFLYKSDGKNLIDLFEEFNDMFFLVYTNGTLITEGLAHKLAELGNVTPAISVEGWEEQTDQRRGKGVYHRIMKAMGHLRDAGVPFGVSLTATSQNAEILLEDDFYEHFFNELGVSYMWQFQLMPIGRGKDVMDLMVTPEQRVKLYKQWVHLLEDKHFPIADFWNSSSLSSGCIAYGRWNGYFYIDWNGNIMPCVFVPYHVDNVKDLYANGKTLGDALQSKMFKNGRKWQKDYGFENPENRNNILMPCSIRDHYENFKYNILTPDAKGEDEEAEAVLHDPEYEKMMIEFDQQLQKLTKGIFKEKYLIKELVEDEA